MSKPKTLWELGEEADALLALLEEHDERDEEAAAIVAAWWADVTSAQTAKLDGYAALVAHLEAYADARRAEGERLLERARVDAARASRLKEAMRRFFEEQGLKSLDTPRYRLTLCAVGGKRAVEIGVPAEELPPAYRVERTVVAPKIDDIRAALEAGEEVPGCALRPRGTRMRIG